MNSITNTGPRNEPLSVADALLAAFDQFIASNPNARELQKGQRIKRFCHHVRKTVVAHLGTRNHWDDAGMPSSVFPGSRSSLSPLIARVHAAMSAPVEVASDCELAEYVAEASEIVSRCYDHADQLAEISTSLLVSLKELNDEQERNADHGTTCRASWR